MILLFAVLVAYFSKELHKKWELSTSLSSTYISYYDMSSKLWQVEGCVGDKHGRLPSLSKFTPPTLLNMSSYVYYIYIEQ